MDMFNNEVFIELVITILGLILTIFKGTEIYKKHVKEKYETAISCLEAGILEVQEAYVSDIKKAREDGKLTEEEKLAARNKALNRANEIGAKLGIDVISILGRDFLDYLIAKKVNEIK